MPKVSTKETKASKKTETTKRAPKEKKDPNAPKRGLSAYMFFVQDYRPKIKNDHPDVSFGETGKLLGEKWKAMSAAEKKPFEDLAAKDKLRAEKDKKAYLATGGGEKKTSKKSKPAV
ncbi:hypothetical protein TREMEDRAFT_32029 [Tremella mesenterica DSM 1558]|nr:uncharacterized protein TREMEDRAFT_32029 [Tremella mesenterica DSM 1558]EIW68534.1 hypothetical protein TREMEDRAFT_32029 [Tremella mesenterica DSM 1558]